MAARGAACARVQAQESAGLARLSVAQGPGALGAILALRSEAVAAALVVEWSRVFAAGAVPPLFLSSFAPAARLMETSVATEALRARSINNRAELQTILGIAQRTAGASATTGQISARRPTGRPRTSPRELTSGSSRTPYRRPLSHASPTCAQRLPDHRRKAWTRVASAPEGESEWE